MMARVLRKKILNVWSMKLKNIKMKTINSFEKMEARNNYENYVYQMNIQWKMLHIEREYRK